MPLNDYKRNVHPAERQTEATESLATPARETVCSLNKMLEAEKRCRRNVGYKNSTCRFAMMNMSRCNELCNQLLKGTYKPEKGQKHEVFEPKYRLVTSAKYRDRVVQSSFIINYFYPVVVPNLINTNCACLKGRGVDLARNTLKEMLRDSDMDDYCLKVDMRNYFGSIEHEILYHELFEYITDEWARAFFIQTTDNASNSVGLDLGSEVYQLSATSLLNKLDHVLESGKYIRYQDDLLYIGTRTECEYAMQLIREEANRLHLEIAEDKTYIQPIKRPIKFLGFTFLRHPSGRVTQKRLPEKVRKERRKLRRMKAKEIPLDRVNIHYQSVRACMKKGTRSGLMKLDKYTKELFYGGYK